MFRIVYLNHLHEQLLTGLSWRLKRFITRPIRLVIPTCPRCISKFSTLTELSIEVCLSRIIYERCATGTDFLMYLCTSKNSVIFVVRVMGCPLLWITVIFFSGQSRARSVDRGHLFFFVRQEFVFLDLFFFRTHVRTISWPGPGRETSNQIHVPL